LDLLARELTFHDNFEPAKVINVEHLGGPSICGNLNDHECTLST
jgi:hypothetical protein